MKVNQLKAGVILTYLSSGMSTLIALVYTPIMLGILGQSEYGIYTLVNSVVANLAILSLGFGSSYMRFYSRCKVKNDEDGIKKLNGMFIVVFGIIAVVALIAGFVLLQNTENIFKNGLSAEEISKARVLLCISVVNIALSFPASVFTSFITANEKYVFLKAVNMIKMVFSPLINLPMLLLGFGSVGMVTATLVLNIFADCLNIIFSVRKLNMRFDFRHFQWGLLKNIWGFSFFIFLNIITDQINWNVDKFLLGIFQSSVAVSVYGVASQLNNSYTSIFWSLSNVFIPRINMLVSAGEDNFKITQLFTRIGRIQFMVLALILEVYLFFGKFFINVWAGPGYAESYVIGGLLIFAVTIEGIQTAGIEIQRAKYLHKFRAVLCFFMALGNILLSIPLCIRYGATGASIGTVISLVIGNGIIMNIYYHKKVGINVIYFWKNIISLLPALILPTVFGIFANIKFPLSSIPGFIAEAGIMCALYCLSMWFIGMNASEKQLISGPLSKILCRFRGSSKRVKK